MTNTFKHNSRFACLVEDNNKLNDNMNSNYNNNEKNNLFNIYTGCS